MRQLRIEELMKRFWDKVDKTEDCWLWTASRNRRGEGYGQININGDMVGAHRVSWELHYGEIPEGLCVLHKCDVPHCVRPDHLFLGTHRDNSIDMVMKGRNGPRIHPERMAKGDKNGSRTQPEKLIRGELHHAAKLTENQVRLIRRLYEAGATISELTTTFNVSERQIGKIVRYEKWKHIV